MSGRSSERARTSSDAVGSSSSSRRGSWIRARASATRWASPPERSHRAAHRRDRGGEARADRQERARSVACARRPVRPERPKRERDVLRRAERWGNRRPFWKTTPIGRRSWAGRACRRATSIERLAVQRDPALVRRPGAPRGTSTTVDLPAPFGPRSATVSPSPASKVRMNLQVAARDDGCRPRASSREDPVAHRDEHDEREDDEEQRDEDRGSGVGLAGLVDGER